MSSQAFLYAVFARNTAGADEPREWQDHSTEKDFVYTSPFATISLRKRSTYPATYAYLIGTTLYLGYGDDGLGLKALEFTCENVPEQLFSDSEFLIIAADISTQSVIVQRDAYSTLPIFAVGDAHNLLLSNQYRLAYEAVPSSSLSISPQALCRILTGDLVNEPLFHEIKSPYDRMRLEWIDHKQLLIRLPKDNSFHTTSSYPETDGRQFFEYLEATIGEYSSRYSNGGTQPIGAELSCGLDSSAITGCLALHDKPVLAASLTYSGYFQQSIESRLDSFAECFGITSMQAPLEPGADFPLSQHVTAGVMHPFFNEEDLYGAATSHLARYFSSHGVSSVFRGTGGNELFENTLTVTSEPPGRQNQPLPYTTNTFAAYIASARTESKSRPIPLLSRSVTFAGVSSGNTYIEHGVWPALPLANVNLYRFCQGLPMRYRHNREILRAYLKARGYPSTLYRPKLNEHFGTFFVDSLSTGLTQLFDTLMNHSVLQTLDFIDAVKARKAWYEALRKRDESVLFKLFRLLVVEVNLQLWQGRELRIGQP